MNRLGKEVDEQPEDLRGRHEREQHRRRSFAVPHAGRDRQARSVLLAREPLRDRDDINGRGGADAPRGRFCLKGASEQICSEFEGCCLKSFLDCFRRISLCLDL